MRREGVPVPGLRPSGTRSGTPGVVARLVRGVFVTGALGFVGWGALALHFAGPGAGVIRDVVAVAWMLVAGGVVLFVRPLGGRVVAFAVAAAVMLAWWGSIRPRNDRAWLRDVVRPPHGEVDGDLLTIHDVRNFDYRSATDFTERWETRTYDLSRLDRLDLFLAYWGSPRIAHTILSWAFQDGDHLAASIETRKEVGESYDAIAGFFRRYELYYVVADERDVIRLRTNYRGEHVYLYPLRTPRDRVRKLLLDYVRAMNALATKPKFYNAGTDNCTTNILVHAQQIGVMVPLDYRIVLNGYIDRMLYERGVLDTSRPFDALKAGSSIDARARAADRDPAFSIRIREGIIVPPRLDER